MRKPLVENYSPKRTSKKLHILSPFDNLVILRPRVQQLFDFSYLLECYVTAKKRKIGYFSLPILYGKEFVGQVDLKADRKTKILWIRNLVWEKRIKKAELIYEPFLKKLKLFMAFNGCETIQSGMKDTTLLALLKTI